MKKILVVSNDQPLLQTLSHQLAEPGFSMDTMEAQEEMLNRIKTEKPDVLLIDFILGDANAAAVCHQVTCDPDLRNLPVIILSDLPGIDQLAAKLGIFAVIKKPMIMAELVENIIAALKEQQRSA
jgi:DNA-binding response OmpR family regulator